MKKLGVLFAALRTADFSFENHPKGIEVSLLVGAEWYHGHATIVDQSGTPIKGSGAWSDLKEAVIGEALVVRLESASVPTDTRIGSVLFIEAGDISAVSVVDPKLLVASEAAVEVVKVAHDAEAAHDAQAGHHEGHPAPSAEA